MKMKNQNTKKYEEEECCGIFRFHYVDKEGMTGDDFHGRVFFPSQLHRNLLG